MSLLRAAGIDPYPSRAKLNHDQKSYVARLWRKYHEVVEAPKAEFATIKTKRSTVVRRATESGYRAYKGVLFVPLEGYKSARLTKAGNISRRFDATKSSLEYLVPKRDLPKLAERLKKRGLKDYEQITAKFGSGAAFKTVYQDIGALEQYIKVFTPRAFREAFAELDKMKREKKLSKRAFEKERAKVQRRADREKTELLRSLSIVKIHDADFVVDPAERKPRNDKKTRTAPRRRNRR